MLLLGRSKKNEICGLTGSERKNRFEVAGKEGEREGKGVGSRLKGSCSLSSKNQLTKAIKKYTTQVHIILSFISFVS